MARRKSTNPFPNYVRVREPDKNMLSELIIKAKGNRSLSAFARECGVSPSTLSRLVNKKNNQPCSDDLIDAIAKKAAPGSGVTLEELLKAYGLARIVLKDGLDSKESFFTPTQLIFGAAEEAANGIYLDSSGPSFEQKWVDNKSELEKTARQIIQNELLIRGYTIAISEERDVIKIPELPYKADFVLQTNAVKREGLSLWAFDIHSGKHRPILHKLSRMFGAAYLDSPAEHGIKFSLITDQAGEFEEVIKRFQNVAVKDAFSIILVNTFEKYVISEYEIPRINKDVTESIFSKKGIMERGIIT